MNIVWNIIKNRHSEFDSFDFIAQSIKRMNKDKNVVNYN